MVSFLWPRIKLLFILNLLMLTIHVINIGLENQLNQYGIIPRSIDNIFQILSAPFIHISFGHLFNNLIGLSIFSSLCLLRSVRFYLGSSLFIILISGLLVWLFGRSASHIGASGWIFGLWSLLIAIGLFDRRFKNVLVTLLVLFLYGGMIYGILPTDPRVSFEAHLFGAITGVICAFIYIIAKKRHTRRLKNPPP